jgi:hypothetical protein
MLERFEAFPLGHYTLRNFHPEENKGLALDLILNAGTQFWHREHWNRYIRDESHFLNKAID